MGYSSKEGTEELEDERRRHLLKECIMQLLGLKTMHVKWALSLLQIVQDAKIDLCSSWDKTRFKIV